MNIVSSNKTRIKVSAILLIFLIQASGIYSQHQVVHQPVNSNSPILQPHSYDLIDSNNLSNFSINNLQNYQPLKDYKLIDTLVTSSGSDTSGTAMKPTYVFQYVDKKIKKLNQGDYSKLDDNVRSSFQNDQLKIIPELFIQTGTTPESRISYRIAFASAGPFKYVFSTRNFENRVNFLLISDNFNSNLNLPEPVQIEIVSDQVDSIDPDIREISHLSLPTTEIMLKDPQITDSAQLKIITRSNPEGYEIYLKIEPAIEISTNRKFLQGMGIQEIPINIKVKGTSGNDSVKVNFTVGKGTIEPVSTFVHFQNPATVYLRSEGIGRQIVTATSGFPTEINELMLQYAFPWLFILMAVLGGLLGGTVKYLVKPSKKTLLKTITKGIILGLFGSIVYYALGFSLLQFEVSDIFNEFAVMGFSGLVAFFGIRKKPD